MTDEAKELADWLHTVTAYWPHLPDWTLYESTQISAAWRTHGEHVPLLAIYASDKRRKRDGAQAFIVLEASQTDLIIDVGVNVDVSEREIQWTSSTTSTVPTSSLTTSGSGF